MILRNPKCGAALLETMIALLIMAMSSLAIAAAFGTFARTGNLIERGSSIVDAGISRLLLTKFAEAMPPSLNTGDEEMLQGQSDQLVFWTIDESGGTPAHVPLRLEIALVEGVLEARFTTSTEDIVPKPLVLARGASNLRVRYWGRQNMSPEPSWNDQWLGTPRLPSLVRIDWDRKDGRSEVPLLLEPGRQMKYRHRSLENLVPDL